MTPVVPSSWMRALLGLVLAIVGGAWTFVATPQICADPGGCGLHMEYWDTTTWVAVLGGVIVTLLGFGVVVREAARSLSQP